MRIARTSSQQLLKTEFENGIRVKVHRASDSRHTMNAWILRFAQNDRSDGFLSMPEMHRSYWVYILANRKNGTLYTGVTNSLQRRVWQHKAKQADSFTRRYGLDRLMYFEAFRDVTNAIARETEIKGWLRAKKLALIEARNPEWGDLSAGWYD
jgi:putative endonuclease